MKQQPIVEVSHEIDLTIKYNGRKYIGYAICHPDDEEFFSEKVGKNIAYMRACINAMFGERAKARKEYEFLKNFYANYRQNHEPSADLESAIAEAEKHFHYYQRKYRECKQELKEYLLNHEKVLESLRRQRKAKTN